MSGLNTNIINNKGTGSKTITPTAITRIKNDIATTKKEILEGIHIVSDEADITQFHAIIEGPSDTPYAGGIFYFHIKMPNDYPWSPPTVSLKLITSQPNKNKVEEKTVKRTSVDT